MSGRLGWLLVFALPVIAQAYVYDRAAAVAYGNDWWDGRNPAYKNYDPSPGDCANFGSQCLIAGGVVFKRYRPVVKSDAVTSCNDLAYHMGSDEEKRVITNAEYLRRFVRQILRGTEVPVTDGIPDGVQPGDLAFLVGPNGRAFHTIVLTDVIGNGLDAHYVCHTLDRNSATGPALPLLQQFVSSQIVIVKVPDNISDEKFSWNQDSTFNLGKARWRWVCCWKERRGLPWSQVPGDSNFSYYACLDWDVSNGSTWDTLISPRINLAGCCSLEFRQLTRSTFSRSGVSALCIRGSVDDGATWPYYVGTDSTDEAVLPWAAGQRDVRLAWIYAGPVQPSRYWAIDDVRVVGKPQRDRDACVGEVRAPSGIVSPGRRVRPEVHAWNWSRQVDTFGSFGDTILNWSTLRRPRTGLETVGAVRVAAAGQPHRGLGRRGRTRPPGPERHMLLHP